MNAFSPNLLAFLPVVESGDFALTEAADLALTASDYLPALSRHLVGDWGDVDPVFWYRNDRALTTQGVLASRYYRSDGLPFWIVTDLEIVETCICLASEVIMPGEQGRN